MSPKSEQGQPLQLFLFLTTPQQRRLLWDILLVARSSIFSLTYRVQVSRAGDQGLLEASQRDFFIRVHGFRRWFILVLHWRS